jgi:hypothetical protein
MCLMVEQVVRADLSDLVRNRREELRLSLRELAVACVDPDTGLQPFKFGWISKLEQNKPDLDVPKQPQLRALAVGLRLPVDVIKEAAGAQFMGIEPPGIWSESREARIMVARMDELTPEARKALADMVEAFARGNPTPTTESDHQ